MQNVIIIIIAMCSIALGFIYYQEGPSDQRSIRKPSISHYDKTWLRDFDNAVLEAKSNNKVILMVFTGSDWCPPCISLHKFIFSDQSFIDFAKEKLVLLVVDFPRRRTLTPSLAKHNAELKRRFGPMGYPTMVMIDNIGNEIARFPYRREKPQKFTEKILTYIN
ncbi:MAG: hypothetical protein COA79_02880 [Planctomycetota bacterium]|nr:MAG: hypothetical protein COA79_02880 [Planctomycetota bacterium]